MSTPKQVLKNLNLFVTGKGMAGQIEDFNPPKLDLKVDEFRGGGMDGTVDIDQGLQKMVADYSLIKFDADVIALFGLRAGASAAVTVKGVLEDYDGTVTGVTHTMRGKVTTLDMGTWKAGERALLKSTMTLTYYKLQHGDRVIHEIDIENFVRIIDGVDLMAAQRAALGI